MFFPSCPASCRSSHFFFNDTATTEIYTLSLHDALPISSIYRHHTARSPRTTSAACLHLAAQRSEEHTSELQSQSNLVCRLLLEKKKNHRRNIRTQLFVLEPVICCNSSTSRV